MGQSLQLSQIRLSHSGSEENLPKGAIMAKPNFDFQKRQKEIAKKKKNEEKKQRKLEKNAAASSEKPVPAEEGEGE